MSQAIRASLARMSSGKVSISASTVSLSVSTVQLTFQHTIKVIIPCAASDAVSNQCRRYFIGELSKVSCQQVFCCRVARQWT
jgi:hypothetical protein